MDSHDLSSPSFPHRSQEELLQQVMAWNRTEAPYPQGELHELFEFQVNRTPHAIAIDTQGDRISYEQLNQQADGIAQQIRMALNLDHKLVASPGEPFAIQQLEVRVGLFVPHTTPQMLAGFWGILKADCAVILLDTQAPSGRLTAILSETLPQLILTQSNLVAQLPLHTSVICLDTPLETEGEVLEMREAKTANLEHIAYLISTSGTTGFPKVVRVPHRGLSNLYTAQTHTFGIQPADRVLQFSPLTFDAAIWEIMMAHLVGATLCLGTPETLQPGHALFELLRDQHITTATLTPSVLALLPDEPLPDLRILISVGEACTGATVARWSPGRTFYNAFGHAEGSICLSIGRCVAGGTAPSVGKVIQNNRIYVINDQRQLAQVGELGELYIAGVGLAAGYTQAALTQERFTFPDLSGIPEMRWYQTGDIVRWLPDGSLHYEGRKEGEYVKVHGVRVEPREIEHVLRLHAGVLQCAVIDRPDPTGKTELVAFVILTEGYEPETTLPLIREHLRTHLPISVLPQTLVPLGAFPITAHGKLDKRALHAWSSLQPAQVDLGYVAPNTDLERRLVDHFTPLLAMQGMALGIDTKLTERRSDSFSIAHIAAEIKKVSGVSLPAFVIARSPTIRAISAHIEQVVARSGT
jgi:amino acid adenylation domain-containing protein